MTTHPVLVTGGAGYIGSHAVHALRDAGRPVAVVDNLTTGFRFAVPDYVPFYEGDIADAGLLAKILPNWEWVTAPARSCISQARSSCPNRSRSH